MKKYNLKDNTMNESELQKVFNYPIYPRDSKIYSDKSFVKIDNGSMGGSHWICFMIKLTNHTTLTRLKELLITFY